jgi:periplasmic protein TonB
MFESLQGKGRQSIADRIIALLISIFIHGLMITLLVVLPLVILRVLPGNDLLSFLIAPPSSPLIPDPPSPPPDAQMKVKTATWARLPLPPDFPPDRVPKGLPPPDLEPPVIDALPGIFSSGAGMSGLIGSAVSIVTPGAIAAGPPPAVPPPPRPPRPPAVRVGGAVQESKLIRRVMPQYPLITMSARISGEVKLEVTIDEEGNVAHVQVISGHPLLVDEAVRAVRQWKYSPTLLNGEPVPVVSTVTVNFQLR